VQITETVPPEVLFCDDYPYYSSFSPALLKHSRDNVLELIASRKLGADSLIVEVASNDGYLLKNYVEAGIPVLGIDPAEGPAREAEKIGVSTVVGFFTKEKAQELADAGSAADVIHGNNVLAHVADTNGFVSGIRILLKPGGVAVLEMPYVKDLIDHCEFDTIYHEHLCYFSLTALDNLFRRHGLFVNDVRRLPIHGGSLRIYVEKNEKRSVAVKEMLENEKREGVDTAEYYESFSVKVNDVRSKLLAMLTALKSEGKTIAAYGAAAKGSTLINYIGVGRELVDFVVDRNVHKQGRYMPGQHLPISAPERLLSEKPDYTLMLTWNFKDEILEQQQKYRDRGGQFVIPIPTPTVV
jgi:SAM-dependent methyltransferase